MSRRENPERRESPRDDHEDYHHRHKDYRDHRRDRHHRSHHHHSKDSRRDHYKSRSDSSRDSRHRSKSNTQRHRRRSRSRSKSAERYRFDSPPKSYIEYTKQMWDNLNYKNPEEFMNKIQQVASSLPSARAYKIDRELYVGNLPSGITQQQLIDLLNTTIIKLGLARTEGNPVIAAWISNDGDYAFIEFRTVEEANEGLALNNVTILGQPLRVGRPNTYAGNEPPSVSGLQALGSSAVGLHSVSDEMTSKILGGKGKLMVSGLPHGFRSEEIREFLEKQGELKCFDMPKDMITGLTKGYAIFDYEEDESSAKAIALNGYSLGGCPIKISRVGKDSLAAAFLPPMPDFDNRTKFTSRILILKNMVKITDLENDEDYQDIHEDVLDECKKHGRVVSIVIPKPGEHTSGIGKIFVEFTSVDEAVRAKAALTGLKFNEKKVECSYHPEELFIQGNYSGD